MSIASEITRINTNIAAAYTALDGKGATLPATQNSANLADTIDTITTGGGGSGYRPPIYDTIEQLTFDEYTTYAALRESGFVKVNQADGGSSWSGNYTGDYRLGILYGEALRGMSFYVKNLDKWVLCGSGVTITALDENYNPNTWYRVDFALTGDLYVIAFGNTASLDLLIDQTNSLGHNTFANNNIEFIALSRGGYSEESQSYYSVESYNNIFGSELANVKDISFSGVRLKLSSGKNEEDNAYIGSYCGLWVTHNPYMSARKKASLFGNMNFQDIYYVNIQYAFFGCYNYSYGMDLANCPFAFDLSTYTSASNISTYYVGGYYNGTSCSAKRSDLWVGDFFFIPHSNWNIDWNRSISSSHNAVFPSKDSIEYFAAHCPTVSNKTFKVGSYALATLEVLCPTALATIRSKGYTIS